MAIHGPTSKSIILWIMRRLRSTIWPYVLRWAYFFSYFEAYKLTMMQLTHRTRETQRKYPSESFDDGLRLIVLTFHRINTLKLARLLRSSAQLAFKLNLKRDYNETESHYHAVRIGGKKVRSVTLHVFRLCWGLFVHYRDGVLALLFPHHFPPFHPQFNYLNSIFNAENNLSSFFSEFEGVVYSSHRFAPIQWLKMRRKKRWEASLSWHKQRKARQRRHRCCVRRSSSISVSAVCTRQRVLAEIKFHNEKREKKVVFARFAFGARWTQNPSVQVSFFFC